MKPPTHQHARVVRVVPREGVASGGTVVRLMGNDLNIGSSSEVAVGEKLCAVLK